MKPGYLSTYFEKVAAKKLSAVEADTAKSNQHEFNGSKELKSVLGTGTGERAPFSAIFVWLGQENEAISSEGSVTWYDARRDKPHRSAEYRLYFPTNAVTELAKAGDLMVIAKRTDGSVMIIIASSGTTMENQLLWLFGIPQQTGIDFSLQDIQEADDREVDFTVRFILDELGIDVEEPEADHLDSLLQKFGGKFPTTKEFSLLTRQTVKNINPNDDPDSALMEWMNFEEKLFRRMERHIVDQRLRTGFLDKDETDIDGFLSFSLSVQNRRKSRAGLALENHLEEIFKVCKINYSRVAETENKTKPDFLFPSGPAYNNSNFPEVLLTMLGVKTSCKDRWRQVLSEAQRINEKHLLTLEPGISENQTDEMRSNNLQLVLPKTIHSTYRKGQQKWLMNIKDFIKYVDDKQAESSTMIFN